MITHQATIGHTARMRRLTRRDWLTALASLSTMARLLATEPPSPRRDTLARRLADRIREAQQALQAGGSR